MRRPLHLGISDALLTLAVSRFTKMEKGQCIIGMKRVAMIPLISFDALVNVGDPLPLRECVTDN